MNNAAVMNRDQDISEAPKLVAIVLSLACCGMLLRFLAFRHAMPDAVTTAFWEEMCRWDCSWYVNLAENGYDGFPTPKMINAGNWAFFPLYPMLVGALRAVTNLPTIPLASAVSTFAAMGTALLAWPLLGRNIRAFTLFATFLLCGPVSFYFTSFFTETLFILLTVAVFSALKSRRFLLAGVLAGALSATRIVGVFIVFAILWEVWQAHRERGGTWKNFIPDTLGRPELVLAFAVAPVGLFAYMAFLHFQIGDALAFQHVQRAWSRPSGLPPEFIWNGLTNFPEEGWWPTPSQLLAAGALVGYGAVVGLLLKQRVGMAIYAVIALTLPLFAGLASVIRFVTGMAPVPLLFAEVLGRRRWSFWGAMIVMLAGAYFVTLAWLGGNVSLV